MSPPEGISLSGEQTASGCDGLNVSVTRRAPGPVLVTAPPQARSQPRKLPVRPAFPRQKTRHSPERLRRGADQTQTAGTAGRALDGRGRPRTGAGTQAEGESEVQTTL